MFRDGLYNFRALDFGGCFGGRGEDGRDVGCGGSLGDAATGDAFDSDGSDEGSDQGPGLRDGFRDAAAGCRLDFGCSIIGFSNAGGNLDDFGGTGLCRWFLDGGLCDRSFLGYVSDTGSGLALVFSPSACRVRLMGALSLSALEAVRTGWSLSVGIAVPDLSVRLFWVRDGM